MKVAVLKGGSSLERTVSLRSGARVEDALARLGHDVVAIDVGADLVDRLPAERPDVGVRRAARPRRRGRDGAGAARARRRPVHGLAARAPASAAWTRSSPSTRCATRASRRPTSTRSPRPRSRSSARRRALPAIEERLEFPIVVKPAGQGSALGIKFARTAADVPGRAGRRLLLRHEGAARALRRRPRPRRVGARRAGRARGAAGRRGDPRRGGLLRLRGALRDRRARASSARPTCRRRSPRARRSWRWRPGGRSAAPASPAST